MRVARLTWLALTVSAVITFLLGFHFLCLCPTFDAAYEPRIVGPDHRLSDKEWKKEYPAILPFGTHTASVAVGPFVVLTSAHLIGQYEKHKAGGYDVTCWKHPKYGTHLEGKNPSADLAVCLVDGDNPIELYNYPMTYETIYRDTDLQSQQVTLTSLAHEKEGKKALGIKNAAVTGKPANNGYHFIVAACLEGGDSGGPAFSLIGDGKRRIVGVNSEQYCTSHSNYSAVTSTWPKDISDWFEYWIADRSRDPKIDKKKLKICGVNVDATTEKCRG